MNYTDFINRAEELTYIRMMESQVLEYKAPLYETTFLQFYFKYLLLMKSMIESGESKAVLVKALEKLIEKSNSLRWRTSNRDIEYIMVAREGFTPECKRLMETEGVMYLDKRRSYENSMAGMMHKIKKFASQKNRL